MTPKRRPVAGGWWVALPVLVGLSCGGENAQTPVTPGTPRTSARELRGLEIFAERNDLRVGQAATLHAYGRYDDGTTAVVDGAWTSSDPSVVEAGEDGTVTGAGVGRAAVSVSFEDFTDVRELHVSEPNPRHLEDQADDLTGPQVHAVYALPSDAEDGNLDRYGDIERSFGAIQHWLSDAIGLRLNLDTAGGALDVTFLRLPFTVQEGDERGAVLVADIESALRETIGIATGKIYAVYYAGPSAVACGNAAVGGPVGAVFVNSEGCSGEAVGGDAETASTYEAAMVHVLLHAFGAVPGCAPGRLETSPHVGDDVEDLMYAGPEWSREVLGRIDAGRDDYFEHGVPDCPDVATSGFWKPAEPVEAPVRGARRPRLRVPTEDWPIRCGLRDEPPPAPS
jgi:hypothetical protein